MGALDKQVTITFNLRKLVFLIVAIVLLTGVFFAGRLTAYGESKIKPLFDSTDGSKESLTATVTTPSQTQETPTQIEEAAGQETAPNEEPTDDTESTAEQPTADPDPVEQAAEEPAENEAVVKDYQDVAIEITNVQHEWYGNWGKVQRINFKIINGAPGTIIVDHATASFEDYPEEHDLVTQSIPIVHQTINQGKTQFTNIVPDFSYASAVTDATDLAITLTLYDADANQVARVTQSVDLTENEV